MTSALYLISSKCPIVRYLALVQEDVYVNVEAIESFATAETMAANRVYGDLHRDFGPSRDPSSTHYVPSYMWPWPRFPPFLGPNFLLFSSDTIPRLLHSLPLVPPFPLWEVWLSGLVGIQAEVLRIGVKDFFAPVWKKVSARSCDVFVHGRLFLETRFSLQAPSCSWFHYGAITGVKSASEEKLLESRLLGGNLGSCNETKPLDEMVNP